MQLLIRILRSLAVVLLCLGSVPGTGVASAKMRFDPAATGKLEMPSLGHGFGLLPLNSRWVSEGDSIPAGAVDQTYVQWLSFLTGGRLFQPQGWQQAVGGQTAAQMATQIAATMAPLPAVVGFAAGTNDLTGSSDTPATIYANIRSCVLGYLTNGGTYSGGAQVVIVGQVMPRYGSNALSTARELDRQAVNTLIVGMPNDPLLAAFAGRVIVEPNLDAVLSDATFFYEAPGGGLHPNGKGAVAAAKAKAPTWNAALQPFAKLTDLYADPSNLLVSAGRNPTFAGAGGTKVSYASPAVTPTGSVVNNWTLAENGGMTVAGSTGVQLNGANAQRIQVSGTPTGTNKVVQLTVAVPGTYTAGDTYDLAIDFALADGYQNLQWVAITGPTGSSPITGNSISVIDGGGPIAGTLRVPVTTPLASNASSVTFSVSIQFKAATAVSADITLARPVLRKVPAGQ